MYNMWLSLTGHGDFLFGSPNSSGLWFGVHPM